MLVISATPTDDAARLAETALLETSPNAVRNHVQNQMRNVLTSTRCHQTHHHARTQLEHPRELTCTGLDALGPSVTESPVAVFAAFMEPSAAVSTTAELAGCRVSAALWAPLSSCRRYACCRRGRFCGCIEITHTRHLSTYINWHVSNAGNGNRCYRGTQYNHTPLHALIQNSLLHACTPSVHV